MGSSPSISAENPLGSDYDEEGLLTACCSHHACLSEFLQLSNYNAAKQRDLVEKIMI
jgi:hypothetical protein